MANWKKDPESLLPTAEPTLLDVVFFAGFFEGEGSACGGARGSIIVQVPQKDPEMLIRARSLWGGSLTHMTSRPISIWVMSGDRARKFLQDVYPYLSNRRKAQIETAGGLVMSGKKMLTITGMAKERREARAKMTDKQRHTETCARWAAANPEKVNETNLAYRQRNREKINARQRERRRLLRESKNTEMPQVHQLTERSQLVN